ncbi:MAG: hemolysin family protein [Actinomycetes bacterium]
MDMTELATMHVGNYLASTNLVAFGAVTTLNVVAIVAIVVLLVVAMFLALAETALNRMTRSKAVALAADGRSGADRLVWLVEHPDQFLNLILLTVLGCLLIQAALVAVLAESWFGGWGVAIAVALEIVIVFVIAEAAPKTWAIQHPERAALLASGPVMILVRFWPIKMLSRGLIGAANVILPGKGLKQGPFVSEEELMALADVAVEEDVIEEKERNLIAQIIEFGDTIVREVMQPRPDMVTVAGQVQVHDAMEVMILNGFSRVPIFGEGIDDVIGIVYAKDLMRAERDGHGDGVVAELMRSAKFVPETKRVADLLPEMQAERVHMAIVVDEYGGTAGIVTLEDLLEELVGEILDEYDFEEAIIEHLEGGGLRVSAAMPVDEVDELLEVDLPEGDWDTIGGLLLHLLGHVPVEGEHVLCGDLLLTAERMARRRIGRVLITPLTEAPPSRIES